MTPSTNPLYHIEEYINEGGINTAIPKYEHGAYTSINISPITEDMWTELSTYDVLAYADAYTPGSIDMVNTFLNESDIPA